MLFVLRERAEPDAVRIIILPQNGGQAAVVGNELQLAHGGFHGFTGIRRSFLSHGFHLSQVRIHS